MTTCNERGREAYTPPDISTLIDDARRAVREANLSAEDVAALAREEKRMTTCQECGREFEPPRPKTPPKYCGKECRRIALTRIAVEQGYHGGQAATQEGEA